MSDPEIRVEDLPGFLRVVTISNPKKRNALDPALLGQLRDAFDPARVGSARVALVRGEGDHFCSGYDLSGLEGIAERGPLPDDPLQEALAAIETYPLPTVAFVRGGAFGAGGELALTCDLRVFGDDAVLCLPPAKLGVVYAPEGLRRVEALVGPARAKLLFFTGRRISASQCHSWGLCEELHPAKDAEAAAHQLCEELAANAPQSVQGMKRLLRGGDDAEAIRTLRRRAFRSEDAKEGRAAFLQKRPPKFNGT